MKNEMRRLSLATTRPVIGFGICLGSERVAEMVCHTGFDFIMVDLLHSHFDKKEATGAIRSLIESGGPAPFARVSDNTPGNINSYLDAGALGIIVPMVQSEDEARQAVLSAYYPPLGTRSKGSLGAVFYGNDYYAKFNSKVSLVVMIETPEAALDARQILSVPGISGCLIGSGDLSYILKESNRADDLQPLVLGVLEAGKELGVPIGISVSSPEDMSFWWDSGVDFFLVSHDMGILASAIGAHEKKYRGLAIKERA
jgi:2-keto-3-deoxy-L-rhamnonate aldolase RhmA